MASSPETPSTSKESSKAAVPDGQVKFSIDNILGLNRNKTPEKDTGSSSNDSGDEINKDTTEESSFSWLQCTRYKPPKLQRMKKKDTKKRKLGRNPRVPFSQHQVAVLEDKFRRTHYLSSMDVAELSANLNLSETRVKIWFQNRRARERRDRDTAQQSQIFSSNKTISPLSIPNIAWPLSSPSPTTAFAHFRTALELSRTGFLTSAFSLYPARTESTWPVINDDKDNINDNK